MDISLSGSLNLQSNIFFTQSSSSLLKHVNSIAIYLYCNSRNGGWMQVLYIFYLHLVTLQQRSLKVIESDIIP